MKKTLLLALAFLLCVIMTACTKTETVIEETPIPMDTGSEAEADEAAETTEEAAEVTDMIPFVRDGEIYFDIHVDGAIRNFTVKVDGKAVDASARSLPFTGESVITFSGEADENGSVNVYIIYAQKDGDHYRFQQVINRGMDAYAAVERLGKTVSGLLNGNSRIFVVVTEQPKGWDRSLSEALNAFLDRFVIE